MEQGKFNFTVIKTLKILGSTSNDKMGEFINELNILKECQSSNVVKLFESLVDERHVIFRTEFGETNFSVIIRENQNLICKSWIIHYFYNIVNAVASLHKLCNCLNLQKKKYI